jgi:hypothetical protein
VIMTGILGCRSCLNRYLSYFVSRASDLTPQATIGYYPLPSEQLASTSRVAGRQFEWLDKMLRLTDNTAVMS